MNKRYMDFVPVSVTHKIVIDEPRPVKKSVPKAEPPKPPKPLEPAQEEPKLGVIEDYSAKFINTAKVDKRPLSKNAKTPVAKPKAVTLETATPTSAAPKKNVYKKKKSESKAEKPVTIITTEKKDSKIGIVVAIIMTIILGATAGTVAFLLLPK